VGVTVSFNGTVGTIVTVLAGNYTSQPSWTTPVNLTAPGKSPTLIFFDVRIANFTSTVRVCFDSPFVDSRSVLKYYSSEGTWDPTRSLLVSVGYSLCDEFIGSSISDTPIVLGDPSTVATTSTTSSSVSSSSQSSSRTSPSSSSSTSSTAASSSSGVSSLAAPPNSSALLFGGALLVVLLVVGALFLLRRRGGAPKGTPSPVA